MTTKNIWEQRYKRGGNSGKGSYNEYCKFKKNVINDYVLENNIENCIDFGCGDGNQLSFFEISNYIGIDISDYIIKKNKIKYKQDITKKFYSYPEFDKLNQQPVDLTLSLDVIYHLMEDRLFINYLKNLFKFSKKHVIIYSTNIEYPKTTHTNGRRFTKYVDEMFPEWKLHKFIKHLSADFFIYQKSDY